ncbi:2Fe-2S iron-sulfur cluster binding domain-containing protein [Xanthobacter dioxanivorans]|uniref:2Fe-2S iron-sulfur cluster binding domain-containing protein n=1 Tax=Xanthobacter dioxanivorans TaxID=2528964 RepID=A0A974PPS2_9HYPH|nr:2Fe-2S iron-sulfur cluster-binding protein [Xanthobacter dioxanivorans]QRG06905.1 2Fe-2S iron-sulfur cluster binding domain-containing protein [Xanthobacter dioxanivorans]
MARFTVETRNGDQLEITGRDGTTLMKAIRKAGVEELVAQCGGGCACATCHVYVTLPAGTSGPDIGPGESRMLATSRCRSLTSRLSCQVKLDAGLDGMHVVIAPEEAGDF